MKGPVLILLDRGDVLFLAAKLVLLSVYHTAAANVDQLSAAISCPSYAADCAQPDYSGERKFWLGHGAYLLAALRPSLPMLSD